MFARRPIRVGERVWRVDDSRTATPDDIARVEHRETDARLDYYPERTVLLPFPHGTFNHSCDPNAYDFWAADGARYKVARRDIAAGEEVTTDYSINSWGDDTWRCNCVAQRCRRDIEIDLFALPDEFLREYLPLLASWYRHAFAEQVAAAERRPGLRQDS